ncbi:putative nuclease HARBI1 [Mercenaria mercenaria]|uniref:putative nuclease HARBI1 n=1 Tax=Mercenaria mercenaria TaxID=6596 RepID=UPI00234E7277|nr:putative nuclease HARBI1 [Mercenaria mercenaria]
MDREGILFVDNLVRRDIEPKTNRNQSLTSIMKVCVTLRYLATGEVQLNDADIHGVSQPTISRAITEVLAALNQPHIISQFIHFPTTAPEIREIKQDFFGIASFPNVIGVIDGTQIQIQAPSDNEAEYVNRLNYHSINTQVVFDGEDRIIDLVARWPGSTHDSRALRNSGLWGLFEGGLVPPGSYLLGDSGYPCKRWLLTPYLNPNPGSQTSYNRSHRTTRSKVERGIGQLKRRWGILHSEIRLQPQKACQAIIACGILHNICKARNIQMPANLPVNNYQQGQVLPNVLPQDGLRFRDHVAITHF